MSILSDHLYLSKNTIQIFPSPYLFHHDSNYGALSHLEAKLMDHEMGISRETTTRGTAVKSSTLVPLLLIVVAGSLITGILSLGYAEMKLHKDEDFVWTLQQWDGFKDTPNSQKVWYFHKGWLADLALDIYQAYVPEPPPDRRIVTLFSLAKYPMWGGSVGYPIHALYQEFLFEKDGYQVYSEYDSQEVIPDWEDYADLYGYVALS